MTVLTRSARPWRKVLYEKQPFPDNYCSPEFLQGLKTNVAARTYGIYESILNASVVMLHIDASIFFVCIYTFLYTDMLLPTHLLITTCSIAILLYTFLYAFRKAMDVVRDMKLCIIFVGFGFGLSPVFKSLTETISTDTIYAMVTVMLIVNIAFNDYGLDAFMVSRPLALNGAIFASICLASRLQSSLHCFTILTQALFLFAVWPLLIERIRDNDVLLVMTIAGFALLECACLYLLSVTCLFLYIGLHIFVSILCPLLFIKLQTWKSTIHGPWDEAVIQDET